MDQLNVGIIGCGYWGPKLVRNFHELPETVVTTVSDLDEVKLQRIQLAFPAVQVTTDYRSLLASDVDAVAIATPVSTHYRLAREALLHGKHVLVEKPLTASSEEAEELIDLARRNDLRLMVGHVFEYHPAVEALRDLIQSGELGDIYYVDLVRATLGLFQRDINVVWDLAPHDFSILLRILGEQPVSVSARGEAYVQPHIHDVAYITLTFPRSIQAHVRVSWLEPRKTRRITVVGSRKMLVFDDVEPVEKIKIFDMGVECPPGDKFGAGQLKYRYGDIFSPRLHQAEPLQAECRHFAEAIVRGTEPRSSGEVGLNVVRLLELADRSLNDGGMPHPTDRFELAVMR
jgi:predicted dehydrogenase